MLIVVSPAKTLDFESPLRVTEFSSPDFLSQSRKLVRELKQLTAQELSELMHISPKLGELNQARYSKFKTPFTPDNARQAVFAFRGDMYAGLEADAFSGADLAFAQQHLRILSGLYGVLRPLDLIQPYRLEMGTRLENSGGRDLYSFWADRITQAINKVLREQSGKVLVNLASNEYFKVLNPAKLKCRVVTPVFKDYKNGQFKIISFFAKKARGMMAGYIIRNRLDNSEDISSFDMDGYRFDPRLSATDEPVFTRRLAPGKAG